MIENFSQKKITGLPVIIIIITTIIVTVISVIICYSLPNKKPDNVNQDGRAIMERLREKAIENNTSK